jgi:hypothetical protein
MKVDQNTIKIRDTQGDFTSFNEDYQYKTFENTIS